MKTKMSTVFLVVLTILFSSQFIWGAARISGKVTDSSTGEPLFGANLILEGTSIGGATNADGNYLIQDVPAGSYSLKISYIGYEPKTIKIDLKENEHLEENMQLDAVAVATGEVVVTAQASGQNAAINQQLASSNIVNVVSSARIQELPDANAAESIGRLPGVSLIRSGGQATQVVIRGISPQYNQITIAGVPIPANESGRQISGDDPLGSRVGGGRGVDMRMISSSSLAGIEVYKTNTPDMDAAVLGGTVNLGIRKASKGISESPLGVSYLPGISISAQGGYTDLTSEYNNYKFDLSLERRFFNENFGVFVQGIIQQQNYTSDFLDANYAQPNPVTTPDYLPMTELNLRFTPRVEKRYNGTVTLDYDLPNGNLALMNIFSQSKSNTSYWRQQYGLARGGNNIHYYIHNTPQELNLISNILSYKQETQLVNINATLSHSYSENVSPDEWDLQFEQLSVGTNTINDELTPTAIAQKAYNMVNQGEMNLRRVNTNNSFTSERVLRGSVDLSRDFNIADFLSLELKAGGMYSYTDRKHDYFEGNGTVTFGTIGQNIVAAYPWLTTDWGIDPRSASNIFITPFMDPSMNIGTYLNGDYAFDNKAGLDYMKNIKKIIVDYGYSLKTAPTGGFAAWVPSMFGQIASDYSGNEDRSAGYLMGTFHFGQLVSVMAGARYQNLTTSYRANRVYIASVSNPYPQQLPHIDTTVTRTHGYWLPDVNVKFNPLPWLSLRAAYTNTLAYPDFRDILPIIDVYISTTSVTWNNTDLKPAKSENYDLQLSVYNNAVGLFTFGGFLKHINDFVFFNRSNITNQRDYPGLYDIPQYPLLNVKGYTINTYINNPNRVDLWGIESDWQTHFWYLPGVLSGLVLNVNYTHVFSKAEYPITFTKHSDVFPFPTYYVDSTYEDKLINQPDNIVNVSLGWDYKGFSILGSAIYQSAIFNGTDFHPELRTEKKEYLRLDLAAKQELPWYNIEVFLNLNNLNGANDTYIIRGNGFNDTDESYGLTAQLGFRVNFQ